MDPNVFRFPAPYSGMNFPKERAPPYMTSEGLLMPAHMQPPPMYGPRGSTIPPKFLPKHGRKNFHQQKREFYCETCDYDFKSQIDLERHISEHQQCGVDGCSFIGHPRILPKHIEQQHKSGLYDKLKNVTTPEEIEKWKEERRKRYPTQANVALRQQAQEERLKRGERLEGNKSRFGRRDDREKCRTHEKPNNEKNKKRRRVRKRRHEEKSEVRSGVQDQVPEKDDSEDDCVIKKFKGTSTLPEYSRPEVKKKKPKNALSCLAGLYGSDSDASSTVETEDEVESESKNVANVNTPTAESPTNQCNISSDEDDHIENPTELLDILSCKQNVSFPANDKEQKDVSPEEMVNDNLSKVENHLHSTNPDSGIDEANSPKSKEHIQLKDSVQDPEPEQSDSDDQQEEVPFEKTVETFDENEVEPNNEDAKEETTDKKSRKRTRRRKAQNGDEQPGNSTTKKQKRQSGLDYSKLRYRRQNTMLEKLLQPDIIHERNVLLQCVRYVVQNNFFGIGQPK
ncbi:unnamed protein product [Hermetia illucens]|uniref:C2H2-type domain-containing protein n=1 Tax=Hermetia illucens TaxID=343691 RepID=A0A7R8YRL2_HERIL|nr:nuclear fragile X mental retardation-interacting protein 1 isoform X1 [Hermetia illucens]CAD7079604.1 unnamed protein product [Hermetia illucens]